MYIHNIYFPGLNLHCAKKVLSVLARYHALGKALMYKKPDFFKKVLKKCEVVGVNISRMFEALQSILKIFEENICFDKHINVIRRYFRSIAEKKSIAPQENPWATVIHGDFWINNLLFHRNEHSEIDDVKFIDFQAYHYDSLLKELHYFLVISLDEETLDNHIVDLVNFYFDKFIERLKCIKYDISNFSKESFDEELRKQAANNFPICSLTLKFFTHEIEENSKSPAEIRAEIFESECSDTYRKRLFRLVDIYERNGWF